MVRVWNGNGFWIAPYWTEEAKTRGIVENRMKTNMKVNPHTGERFQLGLLAISNSRSKSNADGVS